MIYGKYEKVNSEIVDADLKALEREENIKEYGDNYY